MLSKPIEEIKQELGNFYGTEQWHRYSPLFHNVMLTDGAKYIAETCGAYWLMDVISSHLPSVRKTDSYFAIAQLVKGKKGAKFKLVPDIPCDDHEVFAKQTIEYTDFPLDEIKFYVSYDGENWVILLPSEY